METLEFLEKRYNWLDQELDDVFVQLGELEGKRRLIEEEMRELEIQMEDQSYS